MTSRERVRTIFAGQAADRCGFWMGNPHGETWPLYLAHFGMADAAALRRLLGDDLNWICPEWSCYHHPDGAPMWTMGAHDADGRWRPAFADCEDVDTVEAHPWPNLDYLDFSSTLAELDAAGETYRASGMWTCFFHVVADMFGMENYFVKMYTHPEVVEAVTRKVCEFYLEANTRYFALAGERVDAFFFGNDFGTQLDLLVSPASFDQFIMPWFRRFTDLGHAHGYQVMLHSCGAIHKVIERLIDAGVDALHPLQARAADMDAATLARDFKGRIAFLGGIDTQELLVHGTPEDIRADVARVKALLGPALVISPSHEALLPNVPAENVRAMAEAARE